MNKKQRAKTIVSGVLIGVLVSAVLFIVSGIISAKKRGDVFFVFDRAIVYVVSGSMEPFLPTNSFVMMERVNPTDVQVGDVILFVSDDPAIKGSFNTHQVMEIVGDYDEFITKGTANPTVDEYPAKAFNVKARYVGTCVGLTAIANWLSTKTGLFLLIFLALIICVEIYLPSVVKKNLREKIKDATKKKDQLMQELVDKEVERLKNEAMSKGPSQVISEELTENKENQPVIDSNELRDDLRESFNELKNDLKEELRKYMQNLPVNPIPEETEQEAEQEDNVDPVDSTDDVEPTPQIAPVEIDEEYRAKKNRELDTITSIRKSFQARIIQGSSELQSLYNEIKNELLSYKGMKARFSWFCESFNIGRTKYASIEVKGKTLVVYLALDPNAYDQDKFHHKDASLKGTRNEKTPFELRLSSDRMFKTTMFFIGEMLKDIPKNKSYVPSDFRMEYKSDDELFKAGLIRIHGQSPFESTTDEEDNTIVEEPPVVVDFGEIEDSPINHEISFTNVADALLEDHPKRSFMSKLIQSDISIQEQYGELKNAITSYARIKPRMCFSNEIFYIGKSKIAAIQFKGKKLALCLALNPDNFDKTKYHHVAIKNDLLTLLIAISSPRAMKYALELIPYAMEQNGVAFSEAADEKYFFPYEDDATLIEKGLIKFGKKKDSVGEKTIYKVINGLDYQFSASMSLSDDEHIGYYQEIKSCLLRGKNVTSNIGRYYETVVCNDNVLARFSVKHGILLCFIGLQCNEVSEFSCPYRQFEPIEFLNDTPLVIEITSIVVVKNLCKLISTKLFQKYQIEEDTNYSDVSYAFERKSLEELKGLGLVTGEEIPESYISSDTEVNDETEEVVEEEITDIPDIADNDIKNALLDSFDVEVECDKPAEKKPEVGSLKLIDPFADYEEKKTVLKEAANDENKEKTKIETRIEIKEEAISFEPLKKKRKSNLYGNYYYDGEDDKK